jgi:hypothetical protein
MGIADKHEYTASSIWLPDQPTASGEGIVKRDINYCLTKRGLGNKSDTEFDNFYTPKNEFFYSKSIYSPLNPTRKEVRLLKVLPPKSYTEHVRSNPHWAPSIQPLGRQDQQITWKKVVDDLSYQFGIPDPDTPMIACELIDKVALSRVGDYCTVSYCAGSPTNTKLMLVDGFPFNAFANLEHAIRLAISTWRAQNPREELILWADQICINQQDQSERAFQVRIMRDIYRRSAMTFASLSNVNLPNCLAWLPDGIGNPGNRPRLISVGEHHSVKAFKCHLRKLFPSENPPDRATITKIFLPSLQRFVQSPWWARSWICQEFISASQLLMVSSSGSESKYIPWNDLNPIIHFISSEMSLYLDLVYTDIVNHNQNELQTGAKDQRLHDEETKYQRLEDKIKKLRRLHTSSEKNLEELKLRIAAENSRLEKKRQKQYVREKRIELQEQIKTLSKRQPQIVSKKLQKLPPEEAKHERESRRRQKEILAHTREALKGDIERLVTQAESAASPKNALVKHRRNFPVSYIENDSLSSDDLSLGVRYDHTTIKELAILRETPLQVDPELSIQKDELERQIRDAHEKIWRIRCELDNQNQYMVSLRDHLHRPVDLLETFRTELLSLDWTAISSLMERKKDSQKTSSLKDLLRHSRNCVSGDLRDRVYAFIGLAHPKYAFEPNYSQDNSVVHVIIEATKKIIDKEENLSVLEHVYCGRKQLGLHLPSWCPDWTSKEINSGFGKLSSRRIVGPSNDPFNTSKGRHANVNYRIDSSDTCNVDLGVRANFVAVLQDLIERPTKQQPNLQTFSIEGSLRVTTLASARINDEVWVLHGATRPCILRPEGDQTYGYLGGALVCNEGGGYSDIMYGEIITQAENGQAETKSIWII